MNLQSIMEVLNGSFQFVLIGLPRIERGAARFIRARVQKGVGREPGSLQHSTKVVPVLRSFEPHIDKQL